MRLSLSLRKHLQAESARLALWVPVLLGFGIVAYFMAPAQPPTWFMPVLAVCCVAALLSAWRLVTARGLLLALFWLLLGLLAADVAVRFSGTPMPTRTFGLQTVTGTVRDIQPQEQGLRLILDVSAIGDLPADATPKRVRLNYRLKQPPPEIGAHVQCRARLMPISGPVVPHGYDFRRHYYFAGIGATGFVVGACTVIAAAPVPTGLTGAVARMAAQGRMAIRASVERMLNDDAAAISEALLTGVQQGISDETMEAMRVSGLVHILSVSGLHIGLAAGIVFFVLRFLLALWPAVALRWPIKKIAALGAFCSALAYTILVGAPIPAVRSLLMTGLMLLAVLLDRPALSLRVVAVAAVAVLLLYPPSLLSPSFQLSFAAITAIMALIEGTERWRQNVLPQQNWPARALFYVAATALTSLVATLATMPFTYYHFQQINAYGVIANMLAMPLASFWLMPLVVIIFLAMPFGLEHWPLQLLGQGVDLLITIATQVASLPGADWQAAALAPAAMTLIVLGGLWLLLWRTAWRWWGVAPIMLGLLAAVLAQPPLALLSADGKTVAMQQADGSYAVFTNQRRALNSFTVQQWQAYTGGATFVLADNLPAATQTSCNAAWCRAGTVMLLRDPNLLTDWCDGENRPPDGLTVMVPSIAVGARTAKTCGITIDSWTLYRNGAILIDANGHWHGTARTVGHWPWSMQQSWAQQSSENND